MSTRTYVMAIPWDQQRVRNVRDIVKAADAQVVWDRERSIQETFCRMLEAAGEEPAIFLQDDVELTEGWRGKVEKVIGEHPDVVIQFFSLRKSDLTEGARWEAGRNYLMNQCWYVPAGYAQSLLEFARQWWKDNPGHTGDDTCVAEWLRARSEKYWHHVPSLVQHREWKSAIDSRRSSRRLSPTYKESL